MISRGATNMNHGMEQVYLQPAIRGKIGDLLDYPIASARVVLSGSSLAEKLSTITGQEGYFMFSRIPPGTYTLEVICSGFSKLVQRGISVQEHAITGLDMKMDFLEDSRALKLRALSLEYVNDSPPAAGSATPPQLTRQLEEVMDGLHLDRALFNPPARLAVGRRQPVELGIYQNLKEEIMRRLMERDVGLFDGGLIDVALNADLQASGCLVLPKSLPMVAVNGARYIDWKWEIQPQVPGLGLIRLNLVLRVKFGEHGEEKKCLLVIDREARIKGNFRTELQRRLASALEKTRRLRHVGRS
jgi:hypothetical protein